MNCCVSPLAIDEFAGVTAIDINVAAVTVSVAMLLVTPPDAAVMFVVPVAKAVAKPVVLIVASAGVAEFHVTVLFRFAVLESV